MIGDYAYTMALYKPLILVKSSISQFKITLNEKLIQCQFVVLPPETEYNL